MKQKVSRGRRNIFQGFKNTVTTTTFSTARFRCSRTAPQRCHAAASAVREPGSPVTAVLQPCRAVRCCYRCCGINGTPLFLPPQRFSVTALCYAVTVPAAFIVPSRSCPGRALPSISYYLVLVSFHELSSVKP